MRRIFEEWLSHIGRDARSQARDPLRSPVGGRCPCPHSLKASRKTSPLHRFRPVPGYGACRFRRACAVKRMAEAVSGILPREDKATAMRVLSLSGEALGVAVGAGRFYADPQGFRLASLPSGPLRGWGGDDERGTLGRDAALHIPVCVRSRHGALWQTAFRVAAHGAVDADPQGSRERRWSRGLPEAMGREEGRTLRRRACSSADAPKGRGSERPPPRPRTSRAPLILRPRVITRRGHMPRASCGLRVPPLVRLRLDPDENGAPERVELS